MGQLKWPFGFFKASILLFFFLLKSFVCWHIEKWQGLFYKAFPETLKNAKCIEPLLTLFEGFGYFWLLFPMFFYLKKYNI